MRYWTKTGRVVPAVAACAVSLSGCDLEVLNPGAIKDEDLTDPALMPILVNGASFEYNDFADDLAFDVAILSDEMCRALEALVLPKSGGIPVGLSSIFGSVQSPRGWCRSPMRIAQLRDQ